MTLLIICVIAGLFGGIAGTLFGGPKVGAWCIPVFAFLAAMFFVGSVPTS